MNMRICFLEKTIEVTQSFVSKAAHYGSEEYRALLAATNDLPSFKVKIKTPPRQHRTNFKGLTYEYMENYIAMHDESGSIMQDFLCLRQGRNYGEIRKWFILKFPEAYYFAA